MNPDIPKIRTKRYSRSSPPPSVPEAEEALAEINDEIASVEVAIDTRDINSFKSAEGYEDWFKKINFKKKRLYEERAYIEEWIEFVTDESDKEDHARRFQTLKTKVDAFTSGLNYTRKYGPGLCEPTHPADANARVRQLEKDALAVTKAIDEIYVEGEAKYRLKPGAIRSLVGPLIKIRNLMHDESSFSVRCIRRFKAEKNVPTTQLLDAAIAAEITASLQGLERKLNYAPKYSTVNVPKSDAIARERYAELLRLKRIWQDDWLVIKEASLKKHSGLAEYHLRQLAQPFNIQMMKIDTEIAYLKKAFSVKQAAPEASQRGYRIQAINASLTRIKNETGFLGTDMMIWLLFRIQTTGLTPIISAADPVLFAKIKEYSDLTKERMELENQADKLALLCPVA